MIRLARESTGRSSWLPWRQAQDLSEAGKLNRALLEVDGPALPRVGW
jgi:hypothetical protein